MEVTLMLELLRSGDILDGDCVVRAVMTALPWESSYAATNQFFRKTRDQMVEKIQGCRIASSDRSN
jgi:hypothetical protein